MADKPKDTHLVIVTGSGAKHSGHESEDFAIAECERANKDAAELGLTARYEVAEIPTVEGE